MAVQQEIKSQLAKLLATEDIVVEHKQVTSAQFNVRTRVLRQLGWYPTINIKDTFKDKAYISNDSTQLAAQLGEIPFEET